MLTPGALGLVRLRHGTDYVGDQGNTRAGRCQEALWIIRETEGARQRASSGHKKAQIPSLALFHRSVRGHHGSRILRDATLTRNGGDGSIASAGGQKRHRREGFIMARPRTGRPTDAELEILQVLWERGPSTVGEVADALVRIRPVGYTTIQKTLQIMTEKRLVTADKSQRAHIFRARESHSIVVGRMVTDLVRRALGGSPSQLLVYALDGTRATPEEREKMRRLLDDTEQSEPRP